MFNAISAAWLREQYGSFGFILFGYLYTAVMLPVVNSAKPAALFGLEANWPYLAITTLLSSLASEKSCVFLD